MESESKVCYVFNKFYSAFIKSLKATNEELKPVIKKHYRIIDKSSQQYYDAFWENVAPHWRALLDADKFYEIEEVKDVSLATEMTVASIFNPLTNEDKESIANHVYILLLFAYLYTELKKESNVEETEEGEVEDNVEDSDSNEDEIPYELHKLFDNTLHLLRLIQSDKKETTEYKELFEEIIDDDVSKLLSKVSVVSHVVEPEQLGGDAKPDGSPFDILQSLENSKIANLAKEITSEIDLSNLSIDKPEDISKLMNMSGDNNFLGDIVSKVSSKLTEKLSTGELKQEDLMNEAMSVMGALNGSDGLGSLLKNMGGMGGLGDIMSNPMIAQMMKMAKKGKVQTKNTNGTRRGSSSSTRDRLKKKLDERKKNASQQE
jgi:hypothetical protein